MTIQSPTDRQVGYATGLSPTPALNASIKPVQRRLLVPLAIVLLLLVGGFDTVLLNMSHHNLDQASQQVLMRASAELDETLTQQSEDLKALERVILRDKLLVASLKAQDQGALLGHYQPLFAQLRANNGITHFYFHRPDRVNLLRVHKPERSGDLIERFTLREAERTRKVAAGIELGTMGTFTLRVVEPVFDDGALIGYLELGKEVEDVLRYISAKYETETAVAINKSELQRQSWEVGMTMLNRDAQWDRFPSHAVIYSSVDCFPMEAEPLIGRDADESNVLIDIEIDGKPWHAITSTLADASGAKVGDLLLFHDVTEATTQFNRMILMSSAMAVLLSFLLVLFLYLALQRVDRGIQQAEKRLLSAKVAAEAANHAKSEFLANMSHEIRTPMTAILGFAEAVAENVIKPENVEAIATVRKNGNNLLGIINNILDLSKVEAGRMIAEQVAFKPCQIISEVASLMRVRADAKGLAFNIEYIGAIPETIQSDPTRLRQILINLIGNSIKFTENGAIRLIARFVDTAKSDRAESPTEPYMQFDVLDTGLGMSDEQAATLFQPFTQADTSTTRQFGGTGLGLTISKRFAELLGGGITLVESEVGVGTHFRATIATGSLDGVKMLEDPTSTTVVTDTSSGVARVLPSDLQGLRILFAEDGPDNQRLISFILKKAGADVMVVENGKLALDAALAARDQGDPFDCILMDMQMPVMGGYEATGLLREEGYNWPIIALTAHAMDGDRKKCIEAGCDDYATKPIDRKKLIETIQNQLHRVAIPACAS